jgi:hypothetical protein
VDTLVGWLFCVLQVTFDKTPSSVWNMRPDSLGLLLSQANVAAHSRTLLLENCQGVLAAACAERQGGHGLLCCVGTGGKQAPLTGLRLLNLGQQHKDIVCTAQLGELLAAHQVSSAGAAGPLSNASLLKTCLILCFASPYHLLLLGSRVLCRC